MKEEDAEKYLMMMKKKREKERKIKLYEESRHGNISNFLKV